MVFCTSCGSKIPEDGKFCDFCGAAQPEPVLQAAPVVAPIPQPVRHPAPKPAPAPVSAPVVVPKKAKPVRKKAKPLAIILPLIVLLLIGAAGAYFLLLNNNASDGPIAYQPGKLSDSPIPLLELFAVTETTFHYADGGALLYSSGNTVSNMYAENALHILGLNADQMYSLTREQMETIHQEVYGSEKPFDYDGFTGHGNDHIFAPPDYGKLSVHIMSQAEDEFSGQRCTHFRYAVTREVDGKLYLMGKFEAYLKSLEDGKYTKWSFLIGSMIPDWNFVDDLHLYGDDDGNVYGVSAPGAMTDGDYSTFALVKNHEKEEILLEFFRWDNAPFTFNGIEIMAGVYDSEENFNAYAQPTYISGRVTGGSGQKFEFSVPVSKFGEYTPAVIVLPEPMKDITGIEFHITQSSGSQEFIAISEISFF